MSLIPRNSVFDLDRFFEPNLLQGFWPSHRVDGELERFSPRVDVRETENSYEISAELPGVSKEDISLNLQNGVLNLKAETRHESKEEREGKVVRQERRYGTYLRSFDLGGDVQESDIHADFTNGILKIVAPRVKNISAEARRIAIN